MELTRDDNNIKCVSHVSPVYGSLSQKSVDIYTFSCDKSIYWKHRPIFPDGKMTRTLKMDVEEWVPFNLYSS